MPNAPIEKIARIIPRLSAAPVLAATLALMLAACGSNPTEEQLMLQVDAAEAAAEKADAARLQVETAVASLGEITEEEEAEESDTPEEDETAEQKPATQSPGNENVSPPSSEPAPAEQAPA